LTPGLVHLDQNHLSGISKRKPPFRELEPALGATHVLRLRARLREL
jgi:hypothetical protein